MYGSPTSNFLVLNLIYFKNIHFKINTDNPKFAFYNDKNRTVKVYECGAVLTLQSKSVSVHVCLLVCVSVYVCFLVCVYC